MVIAAYLSALSALAGSAIGGLASIATTWLTQHSQDRSQRYTRSVARREALYGDFIDEASVLFIDALTHEHVDPSQPSGSCGCSHPLMLCRRQKRSCRILARSITSPIGISPSGTLRQTQA
jgi:hypothetical protein